MVISRGFIQSTKTVIFLGPPTHILQWDYAVCLVSVESHAPGGFLVPHPKVVTEGSTVIGRKGTFPIQSNSPHLFPCLLQLILPYYSL